MIVKLPQELVHETFFPGDRIEIENFITEKWNPGFNPALFVYDMLHWSGEQGFQPWLQGLITIPVLFEKWKELVGTGRIIFAERRQNEAETFMKKGTALFFQVVFWMNKQPVVLYNWYEQINRLSIKPLNVAERLSFVEMYPAHYASFIQLTELFLEAEKQFYRTLVMQKRNQQ
ncbi:YpoC family protein [Peribacillus loiseleuriae]|uniref:YpoC family protein n=1 Tax=Peribacillus loiseleuriae TaxID=1679170 RepID=UPI003826138F